MGVVDVVPDGEDVPDLDLDRELLTKLPRESALGGLPPLDLATGELPPRGEVGALGTSTHQVTLGLHGAGGALNQPRDDDDPLQRRA